MAGKAVTVLSASVPSILLGSTTQVRTTRPTRWQSVPTAAYVIVPPVAVHAARDSQELRVKEVRGCCCVWPEKHPPLTTVFATVVCPGPNNACSGHGRCMSMAQLAEVANDNGDETSYTYGATNREPLTWDYNKVFGCHCDEGWHGYDCALRTCCSWGTGSTCAPTHVSTCGTEFHQVIALVVTTRRLWETWSKCS